MTEPLRHIAADALTGSVDWGYFADAIAAGHRLPKAAVADAFLGTGESTLLSRSAWIDGLGFGVKSVTVTAANPAQGLPAVQGAMLIFEPTQGRLRAVIDSALITNIKTAADSMLGARLLARPDSRSLLILGAGSVAGQLVAAYRAIFPGIDDIAIWNRTPAGAEKLAADSRAAGHPARAVTDPAAAAAKADIVATATMARTPVLCGAWIGPGTHVDLIGAFKPDMREADDALIAKGRLFVDSRETTLDHIGELKIPLAAGVIGRDAVLGDFYDLIAGAVPGRTDDAAITVFKNGGGAHLDLMIADALLSLV